MQHSVIFYWRYSAKFGIYNLPQSPDIGQNSDGDISDFQISGQSLIKENCYNSRGSDDIDMKHGPVTKLDKRNKTRQKNLTMTSCRKFVTSLSFFRFLANLEQFWGRIPDTECAEIMFSVIVTFFLQRLKTELKNLTQFSHYCFE